MNEGEEALRLAARVSQVASGSVRWSGRLLLLFLWWLLVCYDVRFPLFFRNLIRYLHFPVDPSIAAQVPVDLAATPAELERFLEEWLTPAFDYQLYGLPWVVPEPRETVRLRAGDCEAEAFLLASLLEAKGVPYRFRASLSHLWVEYEGRPPPRSAESDQVAYMTRQGGRYHFRLPPWRDLGRTVQVQRALLWDPMPPLRKALLLAGWVAGVIGWWTGGRRRRLSGKPEESPMPARGHPGG